MSTPAPAQPPRPAPGADAGASPQGGAMCVAAVIVAAGRGTRMGGALPKQYQELDGEALVARATWRFLAHPSVGSVVVVIHPGDAALAEATLPPAVARVPGGETRAASVAAGLAALPAEATHVLIHDGARPLVPADVIDRVIAALADGPAAAPALPVTDALWLSAGDEVDRTVPRDGLWRAQTPQGFALGPIRAAHAAAPAEAADDVEVARAAGLPVTIVPGHEDNLKLTVPEDWPRAARILAAQAGRDGRDGRGRAPMQVRLGNGYDVHRFGPGDHVMLCGVAVPHGRGLQGHSDADVGMHAVTDAIYGALAEGDIGRHFPPSDPQWKGAASHIFLRHAAELAGARGFQIGNADCTLVCERPKIGPHAAAMQARMAEIMALDPGQVSVKATTSERLGFTGREEGIAALATVTLLGRG